VLDLEYMYKLYESSILANGNFREFLLQRGGGFWVFKKRIPGCSDRKRKTLLTMIILLNFKELEAEV